MGVRKTIERQFLSDQFNQSALHANTTRNNMGIVSLIYSALSDVQKRAALQYSKDSYNLDFNTEVATITRKQMNLKGFENTLDLGCGCVPDIRQLAADKGYSGILICVDDEKVMLDDLNKTLIENQIIDFGSKFNVKTYECDITSTSLGMLESDSVHNARMIRVYQWLGTSSVKALKELARVVKEGGTIVIADELYALSGLKTNKNLGFNHNKFLWSIFTTNEKESQSGCDAASLHIEKTLESDMKSSGLRDINTIIYISKTQSWDDLDHFIGVTRKREFAVDAGIYLAEEFDRRVQVIKAALSNNEAWMIRKFQISTGKPANTSE